MFFHLIPSLHPSGNTAQLRVRARALAREGTESHIFTFQPVLPEVRQSFEGIAQIHELNVHFALEPFWRILLTARKLRLKPREVQVWGTELLAPGLHLAQYYNVYSSAVLRHQDAFSRRLPILRRFSRVEANSSALRDAALEAGNRGNWSVVHDVLEVQPQTGTKTRAEFLGEVGFPEDAVLVACVGPISRWKRWQWAIWSIDSIVRVHPGMRLVFFDPDLENLPARRLNPLAEHERHNVADFTRQYERESIVRFLPFRKDFQEILPFFNVLWLPQTTPGSGLTALEAAAAGVPIVAHRAALDAELFPDGTFTPLPEFPETISLASVTHNLWRKTGIFPE
ncbi:MAG: hypothetical protein K6C40_15460 [Thermoguttaceae bacterium]|nr:hypothetical protein [Thermoguttaceae bacterium]